MGHRYLIQQVKEIAAAKGLRSALVTFPVHPRKVMNAAYHPELLTTPEETESTFTKPITKKARHRSQQTAHDLCKKYKHKKAKAFYAEISSLPIAKLDKTTVEFLLLILGFFKSDFYSAELQWLVNFLFTALAIRWIYLDRHSTSDE